MGYIIFEIKATTLRQVLILFYFLNLHKLFNIILMSSLSYVKLFISPSLGELSINQLDNSDDTLLFLGYQFSWIS